MKSIPPLGEFSISLDRSAISRAASVSEKIPANVAATYSPAECPMTYEGDIPSSCKNFANEYSTQKSAQVPTTVSCNCAGSRREEKTSIFTSLRNILQILLKIFSNIGNCFLRSSAISIC